MRRFRDGDVMAWAIPFTGPFGLTEPLFVPAYWSRLRLFDLARIAAFDIESLIFSFDIGGIGAVLHNLSMGQGPPSSRMRKDTRVANGCTAGPLSFVRRGFRCPLVRPKCSLFGKNSRKGDPPIPRRGAARCGATQSTRRREMQPVPPPEL